MMNKPNGKHVYTLTCSYMEYQNILYPKRTSIVFYLRAKARGTKKLRSIKRGKVEKKDS
jgi:hypothetical protein